MVLIVFDASGIYTEHDQSRNKHPVSPLSEILWRYRLTSPDDQEDALLRLCIGVRETCGPWEAEPVDLEDCRTVLHAYNERLAQNDSILYPSPMLGTVIMLLTYAEPFVCPGTEDLVPSLFGSTISHIRDWSTDVSQYSGDLGAFNQLFNQVT